MYIRASSDGPEEHFRPALIVRYYLSVLVIDTLIALFLTAMGIAQSFAANFVLAQSYGIMISSIILFLHGLLHRWLASRRAAGHLFIITAGVCVGYAVGSLIGRFILRRFFSVTVNPLGGDALQTVALCLLFSVVVSYFFYSQARLKADRETIQQERITRLSSEKEAMEANLRLLQAQIEPHFLFNTLSNVLSLIDTDPARSKTMLSDLVRYLRTSLSRTLRAATTLDQEMDMIDAYLKIQKVRMGDRLRFSIEVEDSLRQHAFPPMLVQPLVENAVKHGLEPSVEGGALTVSAAEEDGVLKVIVADTGNGFTAYEQGGVGIANVKERIRLLYGERGRLLFEENRPHGVRAIIEVPD